MSLSVPQNGIKADNEPVIELFVKVRYRIDSPAGCLSHWEKFVLDCICLNKNLT